MAENGQYKFSIGLDNKPLEMDIAQAKKAFADLVKQAKDAGAQVGDIPNPFDQLGKSAPKVGEATKQLNGLNAATQQLVRELPAASMGLNTFFLAISNNLPIFADQVKAASQANKDLVAQGKPTTSVFKQIIGSLFSWQSALVLGVTALSMYGKEIGNWIASLFKGKETIDATKEATDGLNAAIEKNGLGIGKEIGKYESLRREFESIKGDLKEQERFVRDNQSAFDDLGVAIENLNDAEQFFSGEGTEAFLTALRLRAEAMAAQKFATEKYEEALIKESEASKLPEFVKTKQGSMVQTSPTIPLLGIKGTYEPAPEYAYNAERKELESQAKKARDVADAYFDIYEAKRKAADDALSGAGIIRNDEQTQEELRTAELRAKQIANTSARLVADATKARTQAEVDAMAEGINKKIAQINLDYDLEEQAITKREEELRKLRGGMLTKQEEDSIAAMRSANKANRDRDIAAVNVSESARQQAEAKKSQEAWNEYLIQYGTFKEKRKAITDKYNAEIADAETEGERKALEAERDAILAEYTLLASGYAEELAARTAEDIDKLLTDLKGQVDAKQAAFNALDSSESADAKQYQKEINELRAKIKLLEQAAGKAKKEVSNKDWNESVQTFQEIARAANEAADDIAEFDEGLGNALRSIAQLSGAGLNLVTAIKAIEDAAWSGAEAISAMEKASLILAAISAGIQVVSAIANVFKSSGDEVETTADKFAKLNDELARVHKLARLDSFEGTIFGDDSFGNFKNNLQIMHDYGVELEKTMLKIQKRGEEVYHPYYDLSRIDAKDWGSLANSISNMQVMTKHKTWFSGREYEDLGAQFPGLFDADGNVTLEGLQHLRDSDVWNKISKENRELIEQLINDWEDYNKAVDATKAYLSDIFGDMGNELSDALLDAWENGTDAAIAFGDVVNNVMKRLASDIVNTALFDPILKDAQDKALALHNQLKDGDITYEEYLAGLKELMTDTTNQMLDLKDEAADTYKAAGIKQGSGSTQATSKGFQTMSQETGSELNGRFTDIQGQTHRIAEAVEFNKGMQQQQTMVLQSVSETLAAIRIDTDKIEQHTRALARIDDNIESMRRTIDNGAI